jgi:hypothetical protein
VTEPLSLGFSEPDQPDQPVKLGYCVPGCTCSRHRKCPPGCPCSKHDLETRRFMSEAQLAINERAERVMCECGMGPFLGRRGLVTHQRISKAHGGISPRLGTGKKKRD